jgi:hypothetical protein
MLVYGGNTMAINNDEFATVLLELIDAVKNGKSFDLTYDHNDKLFDMAIIDDGDDTLEGKITAVDDGVSHIDSEIPVIKDRIAELENRYNNAVYDKKYMNTEFMDIRNRLRTIEDFCLIMCNAISDDKKLCKRFSKACTLYGMNIFDFLSAFSRSNRFESDI